MLFFLNRLKLLKKPVAQKYHRHHLYRFIITITTQHTTKTNHTLILFNLAINPFFSFRLYLTHNLRSIKKFSENGINKKCFYCIYNSVYTHTSNHIFFKKKSIKNTDTDTLQLIIRINLERNQHRLHTFSHIALLHSTITAFLTFPYAFYSLYFWYHLFLPHITIAIILVSKKQNKYLNQAIS